MAVGDFKWFAQGLHDLGKKIHDLSADDWRIGIVTGITPTVALANPTWGPAGTNLSTNQVATGTAYTGPIVATTEDWALTATGARMDFDNLAIAQDAGGGFSNGRYAIVYNNTDASKRAIGFVPLTSADADTLSNVTGPVNININASGALALAQS